MPKIPQSNPDESAACDYEHDRADKQKPKNLNHFTTVCDYPLARDGETTVQSKARATVLSYALSVSPFQACFASKRCGSPCAVAARPWRRWDETVVAGRFTRYIRIAKSSRSPTGRRARWGNATQARRTGASLVAAPRCGAGRSDRRNPKPIKALLMRPAMCNTSPLPGATASGADGFLADRLASRPYLQGSRRPLRLLHRAMGTYYTSQVSSGEP